MRFRRFTGWSLVVCAGGILSAQGQSMVGSARPGVRPVAVSRKARAGTRLLSADEGLAILGAALESRGPVRRSEARSDCSHLVHAIYEKAGFPYTYVSSSDLYLGAEEFQRVAQPQPGDLVVWRGHAGIVVNPRQHTFFSALRSGFGVESYDSTYWLSRGHPRFLRYLRQTPASVLAASNHPASLKPTGMRDGESHNVAPIKDGPITVYEDAEKDSVPQLEGPAVPAAPGLVVLKSSQPRPEQVREALLAGFRETADALEGQDVLRLSRPLVTFNDFKVTRIHRKGDQGWVELQFGVPDSMSATTRAKKVAEQQRWSLRRRSGDTWELFLPSDALYLPRDEAVGILAHQLAILSQAGAPASGNHDKQAQLARWLDALLSNPRQ
jgi:hypothetical protein